MKAEVRITVKAVQDNHKKYLDKNHYYLSNVRVNSKKFFEVGDLLVDVYDNNVNFKETIPLFLTR